MGIRRLTQRLTPTELGIEDVNLKVTTDNNSNVIDVRQVSSFTAVIDITETGSPTAGVADLIVDIMTRDGATETTSHAIDVGIDLQTNGLKETVAWGRGITAAAISTGTKGTISTTPDVLANVDFMRLNLKASTANDGTTCTGSVTLILEEV